MRVDNNHINNNNNALNQIEGRDGVCSRQIGRTNRKIVWFERYGRTTNLANIFGAYLLNSQSNHMGPAKNVRCRKYNSGPNRLPSGYFPINGINVCYNRRKHNVISSSRFGQSKIFKTFSCNVAWSRTGRTIPHDCPIDCR